MQELIILSEASLRAKANDLARASFCRVIATVFLCKGIWERHSSRLAMLADELGLRPCTPLGVTELIDRTGIDLTEKA